MEVEFKEDGVTRNITLEDICFKPLEPYNRECAIQSVFQYYQNNATTFNRCLTSMGDPCDNKTMEAPVKTDFHGHFLYCVR